MLDPTTSQIVRVARYRQGYLASENQFQFQFQPSISNINPMIGRISEKFLWRKKKRLFLCLTTF